MARLIPRWIVEGFVGNFAWFGRISRILIFQNVGRKDICCRPLRQKRLWKSTFWTLEKKREPKRNLPFLLFFSTPLRNNCGTSSHMHVTKMSFKRRKKIWVEFLPWACFWNKRTFSDVLRIKFPSWFRGFPGPCKKNCTLVFRVVATLNPPPLRPPPLRRTSWMFREIWI